MNSLLASSKRFLVNADDYDEMRCRGEEEYQIEFVLDSGSDINELSTSYAAAGLPSNGPSITKPLICGEIDLGKTVKGTERRREEKLNSRLSEMGW